MSKSNDAGSPSSPRVSGRKRPNPLSTDLTDEPAPKQTRIVEVNSDSESDYEAGDSDATTDEDAGNIYPDGIRTLRNRARNPTHANHQTQPDASGDASTLNRPSQIVRMSLPHRDTGKSALQNADKQPERAIEQSSTQANPQRTVTSQDAEASVQGLENSVDMSKTSSQKGSIDAKHIPDGLGDSNEFYYSTLNNLRAWLSLAENDRVQRRLGNVKIQELSRALESEKGKTTHLEDLLKERDDVIEKLNTELQKEKERSARERADQASVARPCSRCTMHKQKIEALRSIIGSNESNS